MRTIILSGLIALTLLLTLSTSPAQTPPAPGYGPTKYYTVAWVIRHRNDLDADDRYVNLVGTVVRPTGDESYWFTDGTGTIRLDSERFDLPIGQRIVIGGRIDQAYLGFGHLEVDVRRWFPAPVYAPAPPSHS